jgi:hypothetical protein
MARKKNETIENVEVNEVSTEEVVANVENTDVAKPIEENVGDTETIAEAPITEAIEEAVAEEEKVEPIVEKVEEKPIPTVKPTTVTQPKIDLNYSWNGQYFG